MALGGSILIRVGGVVIAPLAREAGVVASSCAAASTNAFEVRTLEIEICAWKNRTRFALGLEGGLSEFHKG